MGRTLDEIKFDAIFDADAVVFNTLKKELKTVNLQMLRNKSVHINSEYFEGREVEHILIEGVPMYYKKISSFSTGSGIKLHMDMIRGEMPILYNNLFKQSGGPEFYTVEGVKEWFDKKLPHILNNKKLKNVTNIGVFEKIKTFKEY